MKDEPGPKRRSKRHTHVPLRERPAVWTELGLAAGSATNRLVTATEMDRAEWMRTVTESRHGLVGSLRALSARFFKL